MDKMSKAQLNSEKKGVLRVTEGVASIITDIAVIVNAGDKKYYFIPYWWEGTDDPNVFIAHHLDGKLPDDLVETLSELRELQNPENNDTESDNFLKN